MKAINENFTDEEFEELKKKKDKSGLTWREFLLHSDITKPRGEKAAAEAEA